MLPQDPVVLLPDVEGSTAIVIIGGVAAGDDHLGERQPVRYRAQPPPVAESDSVQHQALAVVEAQPHLPVLPGQQPAVQAERHPLQVTPRRA